MDTVLDVVNLGRAARNAGNMKNRQPLSEMYVVTARAGELSEGLKAIALDELNIKEYKSAEDANEFISYKLKPQLKTLGPKYGKKLGLIKAFLEGCDAASAKQVVDAVKNGGEYTMPTDAEVVLKEEDLQIFTESKAGFISASDKGVTVALNTALTEALIMEGIERELVSKVQSMRKEADFQITDRISIYYIAEGKAAEVLAGGAFKEDVLAVTVAQGGAEGKKIVSLDAVDGNDLKTAEGFTKTVDVNGESVTLTLVKA